MTSIENVSDTALWVAVYRAMETARPDAIFKDPYAERLAGEKGRRIVDEMKQGRACRGRRRDSARCRRPRC